jgi:hypothetical protein
MALIHHAFGNFLPRSAHPGEATPAASYPQQSPAFFGPSHKLRNLYRITGVAHLSSKSTRGVMRSSASHQRNRLPKRFPVGTTYVVEGRGGENGDLRVFSRYVVLPSGERITLDADSAKPASSHSRRRPGNRNLSRTEKRPSSKVGTGRALRAKKIVARAGTPRGRRR